MTSNGTPKTLSRLFVFLLALSPFLVLPLLGFGFYFRHDDSAWLLWAKEFHKPLFFAVSPDPIVNGTVGFPMAVYWRPFINLVILGLWRLFGPVPGPYFLVSGFAFLVAVGFLFLLVRKSWDNVTALAACWSLFAVFNGAMYNLFHIGVPISYFFQMGAMFFFWSYLKRPQGRSLAGILLFFLPALSRQTTPVLFVAVLVAFLIGKRFRWSGRTRSLVLLLVILTTGFSLAMVSPIANKGSVFSLGSDWKAVAAFVTERLSFYGNFLTRGIPGAAFFFLFSGGFVHRVWKLAFKKQDERRSTFIWILSSAVFTPLFLFVRPLSIPAFLILLFLFFLFDPDLRLPAAWAGASLVCFLGVGYFHEGYLLEMGFPLSILSGILLVRLFRMGLGFWRTGIPGMFKRGAIVTTGILLLLVVLFAWKNGLPGVSERIRTVRTTMDANRNFKRLMFFLVDQMPPKAVVYELSEEDIGTGPEDRRFWRPEDRAARVKIMNVDDKRRMLAVLGREDIRLEPLSPDVQPDSTEGRFLIALNASEQKIVEDRYPLERIAMFSGSEDSAAVYLWEPGFRSVKERKKP